jgi:uncharacterized 2Fe-2S/4Fe-4S cluster protein (DUF4445 family)
VERQVRVTFEPQGRTVWVLEGTSLLEAAGVAGLAIEAPCGGAAVCGRCRVQVTAGAAAPTTADIERLSPELCAQGWRLACRTHASGNCTVVVPDESMAGTSHQILAQRQQGAPCPPAPAVRKLHVRLPQPSSDDPAPDLLRLERAVGPVKADLELLRTLGARLRQGGFEGTAVLTDHRLIDFEPGDTSGSCYGAAFDIGTTTLVGSLLNLCTGQEAAMVSDINPQVSFGDDVITRILHAGSSDGLTELRDAIVKAVRKMLDHLCHQGGVDRNHVYEVAFAGNTTMQHLLCGIDPSPLGHVPFAAVHGRGLLLSAAELGLHIHPRGMAYVFPVIGGFVGGDTVAGIIASSLPTRPGAVLLVDIGTNGEIVLAHEGRMWAASTAAGPALEGARISCGMRATRGAIEKVVFDGGEVHCNVIGKARPIGLCGSGLIDAAAEMLRQGVITPQGRLPGPDESGARAELKRRLLPAGREQWKFALAYRGENEEPLCLTQRDVRELQLAAGAIRAGISILVRRAGLSLGDISHVFVAGGFGSFIRRSNAQRIGLLPPGIDHDRITSIGNTSLEGCKCALLSVDMRKLGERLARGTLHVDLSQDAEFQDEFAEAMLFPNS